MTEKFFLSLLMVLFMATAALYFWRAIKSLAFRCRTKCTYHALWILPYSVYLLGPALPNGYHSKDASHLMVIFLVLWTFFLVCAIIQLAHPVKNIQERTLDVGMRFIVSRIDRFRCSLISASEKFLRISKGGKALLSVLLLILCSVVVIWSPRYIPGLLVALWVVSIIFVLCLCISSCGALLIFWLFQALTSASLLAVFLAKGMPINATMMDFLTYYVMCVLLAIFWSLGAGIADYSVTKMAGAIVNTSTTIFLIAVNILFGWIQWEMRMVPSAVFEEAIYIVNLAVFPIVAAGYLAVLFADGIQYWRDRYKPPTFKPEESTEQKND